MQVHIHEFEVNINAAKKLKFTIINLQESVSKLHQPIFFLIFICQKWNAINKPTTNSIYNLFLIYKSKSQGLRVNMTEIAGWVAVQVEINSVLIVAWMWFWFTRWIKIVYETTVLCDGQ